MNKQYGYVSRSARQKRAELTAIGFWSGEEPPRQALWRDAYALLGKVLGGPNVDKPADVRQVLRDAGIPLPEEEAPVTASDLYDVAMALLGEEAGGMARRLKALGVRRHSGELSGAELLSAFYDLLLLKGERGRSLLDMAVGGGVFERYNSEREQPEPLWFNGKALPVFDPRAAIVEKVYVETPLDTDEDGQRDLIAVYVRRPAETERGLRVPAMFVANPYAPGYNEKDYKLHPVDHDLAVKPPVARTRADVTWQPRTPELPPERTARGESKQGGTPAEGEFEDILKSMGMLTNYMLPRGFASVYSGGIGTRDSQGVRHCGSAEEIAWVVAVIDWLCGRRRAFADKTSNIEVKAWWCNGNVSMSGKSYLGTLSIATAATGVAGLKTALVESAISDWYRYYRENGLNCCALDWQGDDIDLLTISCSSRVLDPEDYESVRAPSEALLVQMRCNMDRESANYNAFWDERNALNVAKNTKAAIYILHGLNDWNVKPVQFDRYWKALRESGVPHKMILHQGEHIYVNNLMGLDYYDMINLWLSHHLYGVDNGACEQLPDVLVQDNLNQMQWYAQPDWPDPEVGETEFFLGEGGVLLPTQPQDAQAAFTDCVARSGFDREKGNLREWRDAFVDETAHREDRMLLQTEPVEQDMLFSGAVRAQICACVDQPTGILSAMLVDYGEDARLLQDTETAVANGIDFGFGWRSEDILRFKREETPSRCRIITRGHMNLQNRRGDAGADEVKPGDWHHYTLELQPMQYHLRAGHRLGLLLYGTDMEQTPRPFVTTQFLVRLQECRLTLPLGKARYSVAPPRASVPDSVAILNLDLVPQRSLSGEGSEETKK